MLIGLASLSPKLFDSKVNLSLPSTNCSRIFKLLFSLQLMGVRGEDNNRNSSNNNNNNKDDINNLNRSTTTKISGEYVDAFVTPGYKFLREANDPDYSTCRFEFSSPPPLPCCPGEALPSSQRFQQWRVRPTTAGAPGEPLLWAPD